MKKLLIISVISLLATSRAFSQPETPSVSQSASQLAKLSLNDVIEMTFSLTGSDGVTVILPFGDMDDYTNGVESSEQEIRIRSNKGFNVRVQSNARDFTYSGSAASTPSMRVNKVLSMRITDNSTGGIITSGFSNYKSIDRSSKKILNRCGMGDKSFKVQYKATPGFSYPAGDYSTQIIFTATQD